MQKLQVKLQPNLSVNPHLMLGRVIRAKILALTPGEIEAFVCQAACENLCLSVSKRKPANELLHLDCAMPIPARTSAREQITNELALSLPLELADKAELLVGSLDGWGFLPKTATQLLQDLGLSATELEMTLTQLKQISPGGIGSADLAGFMLWQIDALPDKREVRLARRLVKDCFKLMIKLDLQTAARKLSCTVSDITSVYKRIILRLKPFPLALAETRTEFIDPCAAFKLDATGQLSWLLCGDGRYHVSVLRPSAFVEGMPQTDLAGFLAALRQDNAWALRLVQSLVERQDLLERLFDSLLDRESAFLKGANEFPNGCSQVTCCERLQLSPSTLSRLVNANAVILPSGKIQWLRDFFEPQGKLRNAIWGELSEDATHSLFSDSELVARLAAKGIVTSRRTVTKYRQKLGFENSFIRRRRAELKAVPEMQEMN